MDVVFEPVKACGAVWSDTGNQRCEIGGIGQSEEWQVQVYQGKEVGLVLLGRLLLFEVAVVESWVRGIEGWLCCIGDCFETLVVDISLVEKSNRRETHRLDR